MSESKNSAVKQGMMQITAGGSAGFIEVCIMQPLDLVKTRLQLQTSKATALLLSEKNRANYYEGIYDCLRKMYRTEGLLAFWKGIIPPILAETPKRAVKFFAFEQYKKLFTFGSNSQTPLVFTLAGAGAGVTEAIIVNPFEVVKVYLQSNRSTMKEAPSTWSVTREIIKNEGFGFRGLNRGLSATILRNGLFNTVYFGFYHSVKDLVPRCSDEICELTKKLAIGFAAGTLASCLNIPFDVAKSRIQAPLAKGDAKYKTVTGTLRLIYTEEGWRALYKGLLPKIMRLGPSGAIMFAVYDFTYALLEKSFPD